jgi:DNA-binding ferritin-like protein
MNTKKIGELKRKWYQMGYNEKVAQVREETLEEVIKILRADSSAFAKDGDTYEADLFDQAIAQIKKLK